MSHQIYPQARRAISDIWKYTNKQWGETQANAYVRGLDKCFKEAADNRMTWRRLVHPQIQGINFIRYEHHYLFFRELKNGNLGLVSVLHKNMNLPHRLHEDLNEDSSD